MADVYGFTTFAPAEGATGIVESAILTWESDILWQKITGTPSHFKAYIKGGCWDDWHELTGTGGADDLPYIYPKDGGLDWLTSQTTYQWYASIYFFLGEEVWHDGPVHSFVCGVVPPNKATNPTPSDNAKNTGRIKEIGWEYSE